ncbi:MAG: nucleotidyl transferase AbiEii/AbiGii toxin family protein [Candidatus Sabulitectum sp.]|nr:nucleotidyl transferase AbiEii/AbiGii toxin family protein [Candidatus Sabulitectum sp.]
MLQYRTIYPTTLEFLKELMLLPYLQDFFLAGGTALALQIGHRISVDIDMFTLDDFDTETLISKLNKQFALINITEKQNALSFDMACYGRENDTVEVDLITYSYPLIKPILTIDKIRLLSVEDIIAMKLSAVAGRGSKKDFYDIFYLLKSYRLEQMFSLFEKKFPDTNKFHILKSLTYFDDADLEPNPQTIEKIEWERVKIKIIGETNSFISRLC